NVMSGKPVGAAEQELRTAAGARFVDQLFRGVIDRLHVLSIDSDSRNSKAFGASQYVSRDGFGVVGVFVVEIIFTDVNHGQIPQCGHVHDFVKKPLSQCAISEEADSDSAVALTFGGKRGAGGNAHASTHDRIGSEVSRVRIGNVHGAALALAVAGLF